MDGFGGLGLAEDPCCLVPAWYAVESGKFRDSEARGPVATVVRRGDGRIKRSRA